MSPPAGDLRRTFVAVELTDGTRGRVAEIQDRLRHAGARLRWVKPENLHFTLRFLGEITAAQVARVVVAVRQSAGSGTPFALTIAGLGAFPSLERPQVVWMGTTDGADALTRLADAVNAALAGERFPTEARAFRPHLTLGRSRDDRHWGDVTRALQRHGTAVAGTELVETVTVMDSRLTPEGPVYTPCEQVRLGHGLKS